MSAPIWLARTRLKWGRMLLTRRRPGDAERARVLLGQALATARKRGLATMEWRRPSSDMKTVKAPKQRPDSIAPVA